MERLASLDLDSTSIRELPASIQRLQGLVSLNLNNCKSLVYLPDSICNLLRLEWLTLHGCSKLSKLPEDLWYLKRLDIKGTGIHGYRPEQRFITLGDLAQFRSTAPMIKAMVPNIEQNEAVADVEYRLPWMVADVDVEERQDIAKSSYVEEMQRQQRQRPRLEVLKEQRRRRLEVLEERRLEVLKEQRRRRLEVLEERRLEVLEERRRRLEDDGSDERLEVVLEERRLEVLEEKEMQRRHLEVRKF